MGTDCELIDKHRVDFDCRISAFREALPVKHASAGTPTMPVNEQDEKIAYLLSGLGGREASGAEVSSCFPLTMDGGPGALVRGQASSRSNKLQESEDL